MANTYREKTCPTCGTKHKKKGKYCSRSCGNARTFTPEQKQNLSDKAVERYYTDEEYRLNNMDHIRQAINASQGIITDPVPPQIENRWLDDHREVVDGDYWIEDGY